MAAIDACAPLEVCVADPNCAPLWDSFVACEKAGNGFPACINMLTPGSGELTIKGAAFCEKACSGPDPACNQKPAAACFECCRAAHPNEYSGFQLTYYSCACESPDCNDTEVCSSTKPVTPACVTYLEKQEYMPTSPACSQSQSQCMGPGCQPFVACMLNCPPG